MSSDGLAGRKPFGSRVWLALAVLAGALALPGSASAQTVTAVNAFWQCDPDDDNCTGSDWTGAVISWSSSSAYHNNNRAGENSRYVFAQPSPNTTTPLYPYMGSWANGCQVTVVSGTVLIIEWERGTDTWVETELDQGESHVIHLTPPQNGAMIETLDGFPPFTVSLTNCTPQPLQAAQANLSVSKTDGQTTATPGAPVTYTITVSNAGPNALSRLTLTDTLPAALLSPVFTPSSGSYNSGTGAWTSISLPSGGSISMTLTGTINAAATGNLVNSVTVAPVAPDTDPNGGNNSASDTDTLVRSANLSVTKTDGQTTATPGSPVTYTITVSNAGPSVLSRLTLIDSLPAALLSPVFTPSSGSYNSGTGAWTGITLAPGGSITMTLRGTINAAATGNLVNSVTVATVAPDIDPNGGNNSASDTDTLVTSGANLSVTKTDGQTTATPGSPVTYTITVSNAGPSALTRLTLTDTLPAALTSPVFTPSSGSYNSGTGAWTGISLPSGGSITMSLTGTVSASAIGNLVNNVTVATIAPDTDPNGGNNSASDTDTLVPSANLSVTKTDGQTTATPGAPVTYTITVSNAGPSVLTRLTLIDTLPAALLSPVFTPSSGTYNSGTGAWTGISLAPGGSITMTLTGTINAAATGNLVNSVTVAPVAPDTDPNGGNNSASDTDTLVTPSANLSVTKTDGQTTATPGAPVTYTITVSNAGPNALSRLTLTDTLPATLSSPVFTPSSGSYNSGTGAWTGISLPSGGSVSMTLTGTVSASATGNLVNSVTVATIAPDTDPNGGNNSASDTDTLVPSANLSVTKTDGQTSAIPGAPLTYTITVSNAGPSVLTRLTLIDTLPAALTSPVFTPSSGSYNSGSGAWTGFSLPSGGSITMTLTGTVSASATGNLVNSATVATVAPDTDPNGGNNSASDTDTLVPSANLSVTQTDGQTSATPGAPLTYTITVSNAGPSLLTRLTLIDTIPAALLSPVFTPSSGTYNSGTGAWTGLSLAPGSSITMALGGTINAAATGNLVNSVTVATVAPDTDPNGGNNSASDTDTLVPSANLAITKTGPAAVAAAFNVTYTITVTNNGPSNAAGVSVADITPAGLTFVSNDCGSAFPCSLGSLTAGQTRTITATFAIGAGYSAPSLANTATVSANTPDPASTNNSSTATSTVTAPANLAITKTGPSTVTPGHDLTYTITVTNNGPSPAAAVVITDTTPTGLAFVSNSGHCTSAFPCALGLVAAGAVRTITATFSVPVNYAGPDPIRNVASVSSSNADPDASNDSATASTRIVGLAFHTVAPCRVLDTRDPANAPALILGTARSFIIAGECGVPSTAQAVSINVTVTQPTGPGDLRLYPGGSATPLASVINYGVGQTRANNAVLKLGPNGSLDARVSGQAAGTVHFILDVNGYFE